jgi:hypothetical protein
MRGQKRYLCDRHGSLSIGPSIRPRRGLARPIRRGPTSHPNFPRESLGVRHRVSASGGPPCRLPSTGRAIGKPPGGRRARGRPPGHGDSPQVKRSQKEAVNQFPPSLKGSVRARDLLSLLHGQTGRAVEACPRDREGYRGYGDAHRPSVRNGDRPVRQRDEEEWQAPRDAVLPIRPSLSGRIPLRARSLTIDADA